MIDHQEVIYQFLDYAKEYNDGDNGIERKSLHSLRVGTSAGRYSTEHGTGADPEVMACVYGHRCVPGKYIHSVFDSHIAKCCLAFELDFEESRRIIREQGFLRELLQCRNEDGSFRWNEAECRELEIVRQELESAWGAPGTF